MTTMVTEVYDALIDAGAHEDKARKAAEVLANYDERFHQIDRRFDQIERKMDERFNQVDVRFARVDGELRVLRWGTSATFAMVLAVLVKLFVR